MSCLVSSADVGMEFGWLAVNVQRRISNVVCACLVYCLPTVEFLLFVNLSGISPVAGGLPWDSLARIPILFSMSES